jgi:hypothetical protein
MAYEEEFDREDKDAFEPEDESGECRVMLCHNQELVEGASAWCGDLGPNDGVTLYLGLGAAGACSIYLSPQDDDVEGEDKVLWFRAGKWAAPNGGGTTVIQLPPARRVRISLHGANKLTVALRVGLP